MVYLYDNSLCEDLKRSFHKSVTVVMNSEETVMDLAAQLENDEISFPLVAVTRQPYSVNKDLCNFTRRHTGIPASYDDKEGKVYYEKAIPINLSYQITVLTSNQADMDEMIRELLFKYSEMYFLTIKLPYESNRKMRFGIMFDPEADIDQSSGSTEANKSGKIYQSIITLKCQGCNLFTYSGVRVRNTEIEKPTPGTVAGMIES